MEHVLIAGGSGLIGSRLSEMLADNGWDVTHLSRKTPGHSSFRTLEWKPDKGIIADHALKGITHIVNLAGESIAGKRWSREHKKKILESRLNASSTLISTLKSQKHAVRTLVAASAIGYYGNRRN